MDRVMTSVCSAHFSQAPVDKSSMQEKLKVLVVDDEPDNLDLLYRTFRRDFRVFKAASGAEGLKALETHGEMAVIISDQRMPKMTGTEFLSHTVERFPDTIRIVLTGYTDVEDLVSAINAGQVFKYITKPWKPQLLKETIAQAAETYRAVKRRTLALSRALKQESLSNSITVAVRSSLDYSSTLQSVVSALSEAAAADFSVLYPTESQLESKNLKGDWRCEQDDSRPLTYCRNGDPKTSFGCHVDSFFSRIDDLIPLSTSPDRTDTDIFSEFLEVEGKHLTRIVVPFIEKDVVLVRVCLYKETQNLQWAVETIELLTHIADQVALAIAHAKLYRKIQDQSAKMQAELDVARQIQNNLLHQSWPKTPGLKIQARCQPAREVGGDFFEVFIHPQGDIWLAVGDVSGKGVPAALFMVSAISVLRRELAQEKSPEPDKVMHNLNHSLSNDLVSSNCFITMVLIRYSGKTGKLVYANAGHVYPLVWPHRTMVALRENGRCENERCENGRCENERCENGKCKNSERENSKCEDDNREDNKSVDNKSADSIEPTYLDIRGVPLGILPVWEAAAGELSLSVGDVVLLTTDGITEATVPSLADRTQCPMLNQEGLWAFLRQQPAELDLDTLLSHVHLPEGEQEDDQTILSLEVTS